MSVEHQMAIIVKAYIKFVAHTEYAVKPRLMALEDLWWNLAKISVMVHRIHMKRTDPHPLITN